jgi:predicted hotdog family 3-hydroxylacyl-ACP dehydratase
MVALPDDIAALLPHDRPMILIDAVLSCDETSIAAATTIGDGTLFLTPEGVPNYIGIEYMAQACGAYAGAHALAAGEKVRVGFLLGTRRYAAQIPWFRRGDRLAIAAVVVYRDSEMSVFDCRIEIDGRLAAEARLNLYQPGAADR